MHYESLVLIKPFSGSHVEACGLVLMQELGVATFCPGASKRQRLDVEVSEDGTIELLVRYSR